MRVRPARPDDATRLKALYVEAYTPDDGDARDCYPFLQLLTVDGILATLRDPNVHWLVAGINSEIVASAAAIRNVGSLEDRISEIFGIVVAKSHRGQHIGTRLVSDLVDELCEEGSRYVLCEARTAIENAWRLAQHCGFHPIGYEPLAHRTTKGPESMLVTALACRSQDLRRAPHGHVPPLIRPLGEFSLGEICPGIRLTGTEKFVGKGTPEPAVVVSGDMRGVVLQDEHSRTWTVQWLEPDEEISGERLQRSDSIISLPRRISGHDPEGRRYLNRFAVCRDSDVVLAWCRVSWDLIDCRARILECKEASPQSAQSLAIGVMRLLELEVGESQSLLVVIEVNAQDARMQSLLLAHGFVPTVYYPAFLASTEGRVDCVQLCRMINQRSADTNREVDKWYTDWQSAWIVSHLVTYFPV
jgi:ribosomal protein S18 acetylase RimI-like enzyme